VNSLYLIADDLTGALDSTVSFCGLLGPIPVFLDIPDSGLYPNVAVNLATRDAETSFALLASAKVADSVANADLAFKKIDSLLRGHWAVELAELFKRKAFSTCVFAPAFPGQGRITQDGRQIVQLANGSTPTVGVDPIMALRELGLNVSLADPKDLTADFTIPATINLMVVNASTDEELGAIVRWGCGQRKPVLWCGSAGLAHSLGKIKPPHIFGIKKPVLIIIGTNNPVSKAQILVLENRESTRHVVVDSDALQIAKQIDDAFQSSGECLLTFDFPCRISSAEASIQINRVLSFLLPIILRPTTLVVAGGETLLSVCRAVGATHLEVDAEFTVGIPHSRLRSGCWDGVEVISKSGAFGDPQMLSTLLSSA
jgi:uncharacterized protein YgbK (DUF1537 family)